MAIEARRGCGYRRVGGTYLEGDRGAFLCGKLPLPLISCPLCGHAPQQVRGIQRITPRILILSDDKPCGLSPDHCILCPLNRAMASEEAGLMWVGDRFYTPQSFTLEAADQGVSRRIGSVPRWVQIGRTWVFLSHPKTFSRACQTCNQVDSASCPDCDGGQVYSPGIIYAFIVRRVVKVVWQSMPDDEKAALRDQGYTLLEVPDGDKDHAPARGGGDE